MVNKKKQNRKKKNNYTFWIFLGVVLVAFLILFIFISKEDKQKAEFENDFKKLCEEHGWEVVNIQNYYGGICRQFTGDYVIYHEIQIINETAYYVLDDCNWDITINNEYNDFPDEYDERGLIIPI